VPSRTKTSQWLKIVRETFLIDSEEETKQCIAVHCLAGLGRAPVLVAIALIEFGMEPSSAISHIRKSRQGALNSQQVGLLMSYRRTGSLSNAACCFIY
jgi:protein tyrosine phosphatase type IVA